MNRRDEARARAHAALALVLVVAVIVAARGRPAAATAVDILRLNVGGAAFVDSLGRAWDADAGVVCGSGPIVSTVNPIAATLDDPLYQKARYGAVLTCRAPAPNDLYQVELKLSEIYGANGAPGRRVIDVYLEGTLVFDNLDIFTAAGGAAYAAYDAVAYVMVVDGELTLEMTAIKDTALLNALRVTRIDAIPTATPTNTPSPTITLTPSRTPTVTNTGTATRTPTITNTPTATATPTFAGERRTVFQRQVLPATSYNGATDAYILDGAPNENRHQQQDLYLHYYGYPTSKLESEILMRFELQEYIPTGAVIGGATLSVYVKRSSNVSSLQASTFEMYQPWTPAQVTWNQAAMGVPWQMAGGFGPSDRSQAASDSVWLPNCIGSLACGWQHFDVTAMVQNWVIDPDANRGLMIRATDRTGSLEYTIHSSFYPFSDTLRPKLSVVWALPTPTPPATATGTATATRTASPTASETATETPTRAPTKTETPTAPPTSTRSATATQTAAPTDTGTATSTPTATSSATATHTPTATVSATASATGTATSTAPPSATSTETATPSVTATSTITQTPTQTGTPSATGTRTQTATVTRTFTPTATPTTCFDVYEPDNTPLQARSIGIAGEIQQRSNALPLDEDWVKFSAVPGYVYTIRTLGLLGPNNDTLLQLYASDAWTKLAENDEDAVDGGPASRIDWAFAGEGTYYARVRQFRPNEVYGCDIVYYLQVTRAAFTPTPTATSTATATTTPTATPTETPTSTRVVNYIHLPIIMWTYGH